MYRQIGFCQLNTQTRSLRAPSMPILVTIQSNQNPDFYQHTFLPTVVLHIQQNHILYSFIFDFFNLALYSWNSSILLHVVLYHYSNCYMLFHKLYRHHNLFTSHSWWVFGNLIFKAITNSTIMNTLVYAIAKICTHFRDTPIYTHTDVFWNGINEG